jgi:Na+/melibiose symporter-like transporter
LARPGKVPFSTKFCYGFGQIGEAAFMSVTLTFGGLYYNQALRLNVDLVGWALALAVLFDAVSDPAVGAWSDRFRSRLGRRHPFLFAAPVPLALCLFLLFSPPEFLTTVRDGAELPAQVPLFMWMVVWNVLARLSLTLYIVPHLALGAELTSDYNERASVFSYNALFGYGFGYLFAFLAWRMLAGTSLRAYDQEVVPRHLDAASYPPLIILACVFIVVGIWVCAFGTRKEIPHLEQPSADLPRFSALQVVKEVYEVARNRNYLVLMIALFFVYLTSGSGETIAPYWNTYFWGLEGSRLKWLPVAMLIGYVTGALVTPWLVRRFDKKPVVLGVVVTYNVVAPLLYLDRLSGLNLVVPPNGTNELMLVLCVQQVVIGICVGGLNVVVMSMLADIVDQHALATGHVKSGIFYSARAFFAKASYSIATLIGGLALMHVVRLPVGAVPGKLEPGVVSRLGWVGVAHFAGAVIALFFYARYRLTREDYARIRRALDSGTSGDSSPDLDATSCPGP